MPRPKKKPTYDSKQQQERLLSILAEAYQENTSLRALADEFGTTVLRIRKLLITAGVYTSEMTDTVNTLHQSGKSIVEIMKATNLSRASVHSYLPYKKTVYNMDTLDSVNGFDGQLSLDAERCRTYRERKRHLEVLKEERTEEKLWDCIVAFQGYLFHTATGLPFCYILKKGRNGELTKELWINRRKESKSLAWSSVKLAFQKALEMQGSVIDRPKALGDIRGVSYIYPLLWRFGVIIVPEKVEQKMLPLKTSQPFLQR